MQGTCLNRVTNAVEGYSPRDGRAHGSIDTVRFTCPQHVADARSKCEAEGLSPYTANQGTEGITHLSCGDYRDFRRAGK